MLLCASLATAHQWYPYYGAWILTLFAEVTFLFLNSSESQLGTLARSLLFLKGLRVLIIVFLLAAYFGLNRHREDALDEERAPLLIGDQERSKYSEQVRSKGGSADTDATVVASVEDALAKQDKAETEARQRLETSLKEKGNWISYLRSFTVSFIIITSRRMYLNL